MAAPYDVYRKAVSFGVCSFLDSMSLLTKSNMNERQLHDLAIQLEFWLPFTRLSGKFLDSIKEQYNVYFYMGGVRGVYIQQHTRNNLCSSYLWQGVQPNVI